MRKQNHQNSQEIEILQKFEAITPKSDPRLAKLNLDHTTKFLDQ